MEKHLISHQFNHDATSVFNRFTNAIILDFNQKSTTFNTSYTQPIGTEFKYIEHSFGRNIPYTAKISEYEKPAIFGYTLKNKNEKIKFVWHFTVADNQTTVLLYIILDNLSFFQRFMKRNLIKQQIEAFKKYVTYCEKTL
ncbi:hypothetical protein AwErysi_05750 [Erysipelotrichaceae bacterium]|nr:hypothetical protein AwErysi_05750 [Erysipelotrichaceae bacterium]